jgi:predicted RNA-binding Zn-ribbon protein involved in translation (DUF1610 family)
MSETLLILVISVIDLGAVVLTAVLANKAANRDIPTFLKGVIGAIMGIVVEVARVFAAMAVVGQSFTPAGNLLPWLVAFRLFGIPILVGWGFMAGGAAGPARTLVTCPSCKKPIDRNFTVLKELAGSAKEYRDPCPSCGAVLVYDTTTFRVISHELQTTKQSAVTAPPGPV